MKRPGQEAAKRLNINWGSFYRNVFALVIPMAIQNLINVGVTAADVIMLGRVGEKVLSGASLAGQIQFIMTLIFMGITSGATVLTAQYWGKKDTRTIEKVLGIGLLAGNLNPDHNDQGGKHVRSRVNRVGDHGPRVGEHPRQKFSRGEDEIHRHTDQGDPHGQALGLLGGEGRFCFGRLGLQGNTPP